MTHDDSEEVEAPEEEQPRKGKKKGKKKKDPVPPAPDPVGATMADRMDAWKSADSLLNREWRKDDDGVARQVARRWITDDGEEEIVIGPHDVLILATWLLYGAIAEED